MTAEEIDANFHEKAEGTDSLESSRPPRSAGRQLGVRMNRDEMTSFTWRRSSFSGGGGPGGGNCVEVAWLVDGRMAVRDSKAPGAGVVFVGIAGLAALLGECKSGGHGA